MDGAAFAPPATWHSIVTLEGESTQSLLARYDCVIHLQTAAVCAKGEYEWGPTAKNPHRFHSPGCPHLAWLDLAYAEAVTGAGLQAIAAGCSAIIELDISCCGTVEDVSVRLLILLRYGPCRYRDGRSPGRGARAALCRLRGELVYVCHQQDNLRNCVLCGMFHVHVQMYMQNACEMRLLVAVANPCMLHATHRTPWV